MIPIHFNYRKYGNSRKATFYSYMLGFATSFAGGLVNIFFGLMLISAILKTAGISGDAMFAASLLIISAAQIGLLVGKKKLEKRIDIVALQDLVRQR